MEIKMAAQDFDNELNEKRKDLMEQIGNEFGIEINALLFFGMQPKTESFDNALAEYDERVVPLESEYASLISSTIQKIETEYTNSLSTQTNVARNLARLSPVSCFMFLVSEIAGTGIHESENIRENASIFQKMVTQEVYDRILLKSYATPDGARLSMPQIKDGLDPKDIPVPQLNQYRRATLAEIFETEWVDIVLLLLYTILFFTISFVSFIRYDVR